MRSSNFQHGRLIVGLALALTLGGSALAESSWNGRTLVEWAARDSAFPLNVVWPGYERPLHQSRIDSFVTFDVERPGRFETDLPEGVAFSAVRTRPLSRAQGRLENGRLVFDVKGPEQFVVEFGEGRPQLHVFANPPFAYERRPDDLYFGPGEHEAGLIEPKSGQRVCLAEGAVVYGALLLENVTNVTITGRGILDSSKIRRTHSDGRYLRTLSAEEKADLTDVTSFMCRQCANVRVEGVVFRDSPFWILIVRNGCRNVVFDNVKTVGQWRYNADGIDICGCEDVVVRNSFIRSFDDSFVVRDGGISSDLGSCQPARNIRCENTILWCDWGYNFKAQLTGKRGALIENVVVSNCVFANVQNAGIVIAARPGGPDVTIRDVTVAGIEYDVPPPRYGSEMMTQGPRQKFVGRLRTQVGLFDVKNYDLMRKDKDGKSRKIDVSNFNILYDRLTFRDFRVLGEYSSLHGRFSLTAGKEEIRDLVLENLPEGVYYSKKATFTNPKGLK